jgi:hypothetical protein
LILCIISEKSMVSYTIQRVHANRYRFYQQRRYIFTNTACTAMRL